MTSKHTPETDELEDDMRLAGEDADNWALRFRNLSRSLEKRLRFARKQLNQRTKKPIAKHAKETWKEGK